LLTDASGRRVERVKVRSIEGKIWHVRAKVFVLACGGIENPRMLLVSNRTNRAGLGNDRDLVGRFFHEHPQAACGVLVTDSSSRRARLYSRLSPLGPSWCAAGLALTRKAQSAYGTLNGSIAIEPLYEGENALTAFRKLRSDFRARRISSEALKCLWRIAADS